LGVHGVAVVCVESIQFSKKVGMHILLLTDSYPNAYLEGQGVFVRDQALALASAGHRVGVVALVPVSLKDIFRKGLTALGSFHRSDDGVEVMGRCYMQIPRWYGYPIRRSLSLGRAEVVRYIKANGTPDVFHVHGFHTAKLAARVKEKYHMPVIVTEHNSRFLSGAIDAYRLEVALDFYRSADARIAVSESFSKKLQQLSGVSFQVVPNAVDISLFQLKEGNARNVFLSVGNFTENKNQQLQLEAFHEALPSMPNAELWLAGDGPRLDRCKSLAKDLNIESRVKFLGRITREKVIECLGVSRAFLITSHHETFGVVAIEALACGVPVISTRCGGPEEILGEHGHWIEPTPESLAQAMLSEYASNQQVPSHDLRAYCEKRFSYASVAAQLAKVYSQLVGRAL
jgi:glycosyltransferase involved in cell wall biosynthesis